MADMTTDLARDVWRSYFDTVSRELETMQATVEIDASDLGAQVQAEGLVLTGISYDDRDDIVVIGLSSGGPDEVLEHVVSGPKRIRVETAEGAIPSAVEIEDAEGQRTLLRVRRVPTLAPE